MGVELESSPSLAGSAFRMSHHHHQSPVSTSHFSSPSVQHVHIKKEETHLPSPQSENEEPSSSGQKGMTLSAKCKRKINFTDFPPTKQQPTTVARRNARERNRVKQVNNGFSALKQHIPPSHRAKKMSKVETLKCAVDYIRKLQDDLDISMLSGGDQPKLLFGNMSDFESSYAGSRQGSEQMSPSSSDTGERPFLHQPGVTGGQVIYDYDNYEPVSPDEAELLDAISIWQQS